MTVCREILGRGLRVGLRELLVRVPRLFPAGPAAA